MTPFLKVFMSHETQNPRDKLSFVTGKQRPPVYSVKKVKMWLQLGGINFVISNNTLLSSVSVNVSFPFLSDLLPRPSSQCD